MKLLGSCQWRLVEGVHRECLESVYRDGAQIRFEVGSIQLQCPRWFWSFVQGLALVLQTCTYRTLPPGCMFCNEASTRTTTTWMCFWMLKPMQNDVKTVSQAL